MQVTSKVRKYFLASKRNVLCRYQNAIGRMRKNVNITNFAILKSVPLSDKCFIDDWWHIPMFPFSWVSTLWRSSWNSEQWSHIFTSYVFYLSVLKIQLFEKMKRWINRNSKYFVFYDILRKRNVDIMIKFFTPLMTMVEYDLHFTNFCSEYMASWKMEMSIKYLYNLYWIYTLKE